MPRVRLVARLYLVEANILRSPTATTLEDGTRLRVDLDGKFCPRG